MRIAIGSDHRGRDAVDGIAEHLAAGGHEVTRLGPCSADSGPCDYPESARAVAEAVARGEADRGILVCGTGIGMSIAANKVPGVRAALVQDELYARLSRSHNDANVLCLSGDMVSGQRADLIVDAFLHTEFEGGRHARRVEKIAAMEQQAAGAAAAPDAAM